MTNDGSCPCGKLVLTTGDPCPFCGGYPGEPPDDCGLDAGADESEMFPVEHGGEA